MTDQRAAGTPHLRLVSSSTSGVLTGRFRRARQLDDCAEQATLVRAAVNRAKQGDNEAIRYLYVQYADNVYGYVLSVVRDEHEAEDVTQHVFAKLMTVLDKYEPREVPFSAWVLRVARNVAVDHMRRRRTLPCEEVRENDGEGRELGHEDALSMRQALATLPPEQRKVVVLRHVVGLSPGEIAREMGKTESSIHGLHHRARGALQDTLTEMGMAPSTAA